MNNVQLLEAVKLLQLRLLGRMLLDTPEDVPAAFAHALLLARLEHEPMVDQRRLELAELVNLLAPPALRVGQCEHVLGCNLDADVQLQRAGNAPGHVVLLHCCAAHANQLLAAEPSRGWTHGVER